MYCNSKKIALNFQTAVSLIHHTINLISYGVPYANQNFYVNLGILITPREI